ncbi:MAG TPA: ABC transporter ATP-binding protein [Candidatus Pelethenecus faecipullorum]|uniref:ABC transporter ATP-binding protein n=1 Tax=Candidatus Pelethenecus faecipullorum TaxID=2840900 RepID=A0A9D1GS07_9MOLU|nr:ABC transporter ATP-binding protein [Candidatus Pelethenecus faecipullorum]
MFYVRHLTLRYGIQTLFDDAEFTIKSPGLYLLKGKNGYGKTTLFKILKGLIPSPCQIQFGQKQDPFDQISYVNAKLTVFERLTVLENLLLFEKDEQKIADLIRQVGLSDQWKKKKTKNLSAGEKQRLAICMALLEDKPILLLDEPTSHVDADTAEILLQLLKHVSKNKIILCTSHQDIQQQNGLWDGILSIEGKKIVFPNDPEEKPLPQEIKPSYYNPKLLNKIIFFKAKPLFCFFWAVLSLMLMLCLQMASLSQADIYYRTIQFASEPLYLINEYRSSELFYLPFEGFSCSSSLSSYLEKNASEMVEVRNLIQHDFFTPFFELEENETIYPSDHIRLNQILFTDTYQEIPLTNGEVVISDYLYHQLENGYLQQDDETTYFEVCGMKLIVKGCFQTQYETFLQLDESVYQKMPEYINEANYLYYRCYMTKDTYYLLKEAYYSFFQNETYCQSISGLKNLEDGETRLLLQGTFPKTDTECLVSTGYLKQHAISFDILGRFNLFSARYQPKGYSNPTVFDAFLTVSGIFESAESCIVLKDAEAQQKMMDDRLDEAPNFYLNQQQLSLSTVEKIMEENCMLSYSNNHLLIDAFERFSLIQPIVRRLVVVFILLNVFLICISFFLETTRKENDLALLKEKTIPIRSQWFYHAFYHLFSFGFYLLLTITLYILSIRFLCPTVFESLFDWNVQLLDSQWIIFTLVAAFYAVMGIFLTLLIQIKNKITAFIAEKKACKGF